MKSISADHWSLRSGRWRGLEFRLHVLFPLLALTAFLLAGKSSQLEPRTVSWGLVILGASVLLHEIARLVAAWRVGGRGLSLVLGPWGGFSQIQLPADPPAHLLTALAGPAIHVGLFMLAACGLALGGDREVFRLLLYPSQPDLTMPLLSTERFSWEHFAELVVWINGCLLLIDLLPVGPCSGAELLRGMLWPVVGRATAATATAHIAQGAAVLFAALALLFANSAYQAAMIPGWFPAAVVAVVLLFGSRSSAPQHLLDVGLAIDKFDSDDEDWLKTDWLEEDREAVLVEHVPDKQQETLDRKRREREANEDARVDAILARLHETGLDQLSEEEHALLKRASRRYQQRRAAQDDMA